MSQVLTSRRRTVTSLRGHRDAHTVLLRMALDEERAKRIRALKEDRPDLTWAQIAEAVGVKERSAIDWQKTGGISHPNAKKLAAFLGVDADWLWSGAARGATPDLMGALSGDAQLSAIDAKLDELLRRVAALELGAALEPESAQRLERIERLVEALSRKSRSRRAS